MNLLLSDFSLVMPRWILKRTDSINQYQPGITQRLNHFAPCHHLHHVHRTEDRGGGLYRKKYAGVPNRNFFSMNEIADGILRKNNINAVLTKTEIARNKAISEKRYIVNQYFGLVTLFEDRTRERFTTIVKTVSMPSSGSLHSTCARGRDFKAPSRIASV
jgi:IS5 family transposase